MRFSGRFMQAAVDAGTAVGRSRRTAINPSTIRKIAATRPGVRAMESVAPRVTKASGAIEAVLPKRSISMATRGSDLLSIVESGEISSRKATTSGYLGNKKFLEEAGVREEGGFTGYNSIRHRLESGPLQGNSNYGFVRASDDVITASQYRSFRVNMSEHGELYSSPAGARKATFEHEVDELMGGAIINLKRDPRMTYTLGDSYGLDRRGLLQTSGVHPMPEDLGTVPLVAEHRRINIPDAPGGYTEAQFPDIPFDSSAVESVDLMRDTVQGKPGDIASAGWGAEYLHFVSPQEQLVMQRDVAQRIAARGIKVNTGTIKTGLDAEGELTQTFIRDEISLGELTQEQFDQKLMDVTNQIKAKEAKAAAEAAAQRARYSRNVV